MLRAFLARDGRHLLNYGVFPLVWPALPHGVWRLRRFAGTLHLLTAHSTGRRQRSRYAGSKGDGKGSERRLEAVVAFQVSKYVFYPTTQAWPPVVASRGIAATAP